MNFHEFAEKHGITIDAIPLATRTDSSAAQFSKLACHYQVTLTFKGRTIFNGAYSLGIGIIEAWAREQPSSKIPAEYSSRGGHFNLWEALRNPLPYGKRYRDDSPYYAGLKAMAAKHYRPAAGDILESIASDASNSDQHFKEWAADHGYSDDSISAKATWEACNDIRRTLESGLGREAYAELLECEG